MLGFMLGFKRRRKVVEPTTAPWLGTRVAARIYSQLFVRQQRVVTSGSVQLAVCVVSEGTSFQRRTVVAECRQRSVGARPVSHMGIHPPYLGRKLRRGRLILDHSGRTPSGGGTVFEASIPRQPDLRM